jgi:hypothetical protein
MLIISVNEKTTVFGARKKKKQLYLDRKYHYCDVFEPAIIKCLSFFLNHCG